MAETKKRTTTRKTAKAEAKPVEKIEKVENAESVAVETPKVEAQPQINMVVEQKAPPVKILYIDSCIPNNQIPIGNGRYITGSGRVFSVPMEHFEGEFQTPLTMKLIDNRKFIVLSGLTEEQRYQYNCHYAEGEVVKNEGIFDALFDMDTEQAGAIFDALCPEHQALVATRFATAYYERHDNRVTRDKVELLNKLSKKHDAGGLFTPIVKDINEKIV